MIYENLNKLNIFKSNILSVPFDCKNRAIPSIIYIPDSNTLKPIIDNYNFSVDDMYNIGKFSEVHIERLPIYINNFQDERYQITCNFDKYNLIFDAAAIGQYLGGVDERNISGDTRGFCNETCLIKFIDHDFYWIKKEDNLYRPFIKIDEKLIQIFNLHIHSKKLVNFMANNPIEQKFISLVK